MSTSFVIAIAIVLLTLLPVWIVRCEIRNYRRHGVRGVILSVLLRFTPW